MHPVSYDSATLFAARQLTFRCSTNYEASSTSELCYVFLVRWNVDEYYTAKCSPIESMFFLFTTALVVVYKPAFSTAFVPVELLLLDCSSLLACIFH